MFLKPFIDFNFSFISLDMVDYTDAYDIIETYGCLECNRRYEIVYEPTAWREVPKYLYEE
jgi:hypothetical protein